MKIRGLLAGLVVAVALNGCTGSATVPDPVAAPALFEEAPPPPDTTTERSGGAMGSGN